MKIRGNEAWKRAVNAEEMKIRGNEAWKRAVNAEEVKIRGKEAWKRAVNAEVAVGRNGESLRSNCEDSKLSATRLSRGIIFCSGE